MLSERERARARAGVEMTKKKLAGLYPEGHPMHKAAQETPEAPKSDKPSLPEGLSKREKLGALYPDKPVMNPMRAEAEAAIAREQALDNVVPMQRKEAGPLHGLTRDEIVSWAQMHDMLDESSPDWSKAEAAARLIAEEQMAGLEESANEEKKAA